MEGVSSNQAFLSEIIGGYASGYAVERIYKIDLALLLIASFEILFMEDVPVKVSVNEAVELAKVYSTDNSPSFINGILASVIKNKEDILNERTLIDGKLLSAEIRSAIKADASEFEDRYGRKIGLAVILAGDDPASKIYVRNKISACEETGIRSFEYYLPATVTTEELIELVEAVNRDDNIDGLLVQLPLPSGVDESAVLKAVSPEKDVDGFHAVNAGNLMLGNPCLAACTPAESWSLLKVPALKSRGKMRSSLDEAI